jgi:type II secretory pathway component PulF
MTSYNYKALNHNGEIITGRLTANSRDEVAAKFAQQNATLLSLKKYKDKNKVQVYFKAKVKKHTLLLFTRHLQFLLKSGLPLLDAIELLVDQTADENFKTILRNICQDIKDGSSFSKALAKYPHIFSELYSNSIHVGEMSGTLDEVLLSILDHIEDEIKFEKNIKKATRYPLLVMGALLIAFIIFITVVIPKFVPIFEKGGTELPLPTRMLLLINDIFTNYGIFALIILAILVIALFSFYRTSKGRYVIDQYLLKVPIYGNLLKKFSILRFSSTLALLNSNGIPLVTAMATATRIESNQVYKQEISSMRDFVEKGGSIAGALKKSDLFPKLMIQIVSVGEMTGSLDDMLNNVAEFNNAEIEHTIENLTSLIEPIITVILAIVVLFLALAIFLPMWDMFKFV